MARSRSVSLKGAAAQAFIEMAIGKPAESPEQALERVATMVHMFVKTDQMPKAVEVLKQLLSGSVPATST
jgi:hypothetical protein